MDRPDVPLEDLPHPSLIIDDGSVVVAANADARELFGDVRGETVSSLFVDADPSLSTLRDAESELYLVDRPRGDVDTWQASVRGSSLGDDHTLLVFRDPGQRPPLEQAGGKLDALLSYIPVSVYFKDRKSRHVRVSAHQARDLRDVQGIVHHTPVDVEGKTEYDLYPKETADAAVADDEFIMNTGEPLEQRDEHVDQSDSESYWRTSKAPWYEDGEMKGVLGVTVDVTDQVRHARELERQNERLDEFARIVSHDLRNPLSVASNSLELYRETGDDEHLATVAAMHDRMGTLIEDTLTLARSGERVTEPSDVDVREPIERAWASVVTDEATLECDWQGRIVADEDRLVQLLENLFRNAVEHARSDVTITVEPLPDGNGFAVEDDGPGFSTVDRKAVFELGYSAGDEGTGLGLSIVRQIVEAHGWSIRATDGADGGARFEIHFEPDR